jgi:hypothetical protein
MAVLPVLTWHSIQPTAAPHSGYFRCMIQPQKFALLFAFLLGSYWAVGQNPVQLWMTYNNQARFSEKWGLSTDFNYRTRGFFPFNSSLLAGRVGAVYRINDAHTCMAGYALFATKVNGYALDWLPEHRLWQQWQVNQGRETFRWSHRVRTEQRFRSELADATTEDLTFTFTFRARYMFQMQGLWYTTPKGMDVSWQAANEIMFQFGNPIASSNFDQNRTLFGVVLAPNETISLAILYQFIAQYQAQINEVEPVHSFRLTLFHNLDFR